VYCCPTSAKTPPDHYGFTAPDPIVLSASVFRKGVSSDESRLVLPCAVYAPGVSRAAPATTGVMLPLDQARPLPGGPPDDDIRAQRAELLRQFIEEALPHHVAAATTTSAAAP
jgi:hypothetical protein